MDVGVDLSSVLIADLVGASRVQSAAPDLGAFEGGGGEAPIFVDVTTATGFGWDGASSDPTNWAGGWHWGDYDNDGDLDAVLTGRSQAGFFRNVGSGAGFSVATHSTGDRSRQAALGDFDNDGDLDLWHSWDERLLLNAGDGTFADAGSSGLSAPSNIEGVAPVDVDRDGLLDMVVPSQGGNYIGLNTGADPFAFNTAKNESDGFHVSGAYGNGDYVSTADVNGDGITDLFYHYNGGKLFLGNGTGGFTLTPLGVTLTTGNSDKFGSAWGDYDNDGDMDLFTCRYDDGQRGYLLRNDSGTFVDVTVAAGVDDGDRQFSADWGDYDNDGDLDLYVTTASGAANRLYENNGDGTFESVNKGAAIGVDAVDAAFVDYDNDGDLDLAVSIEDENTRLLRNTTDGQASLRVRVIGMGEGGTNASGIGTRVELIAGDGVTVLATREVGGARGYGGSSSLWVHFGGVDPAATYTVRTRFISGVVDKVVVPSSVQSIIGGTTVPRLLTVTEPTRRGYDMVQWSEVDPSSEP
ncbi:MAG: CRTAC1 family protein [Planctomycetota bacterium]